MSRANSIRNKLDKALSRVGPSDRTVYKRFVVQTGGDQLIGRPASVAQTDTLLNPQPQYFRLTRYVVGNSAPAKELFGGSSEHVADDYGILLSPTAINSTELGDKTLFIVFKDANNNEETFRVTDVEPLAMNSIDIMFLAYIRSAKRPA